jgi:hypothetical protein
MHPGELPLEDLLPITTINVLSIGSVLIYLGTAKRLVALAAQMLLDSISKSLDQTKPVRDLPGLGRSHPGAFGVERMTIAANDLERRTLGQPGGLRRRGTISRHVRDGSCFKIREDGSTCGASAPGPFIGAGHTDCGTIGLYGSLASLYTPRDCACAHWRARLGHQSLRWSLTHAVAKQPNYPDQAGGPARKRGCRHRKPFGEDPMVTLIILASPAGEPRLDCHRRP